MNTVKFVYFMGILGYCCSYTNSLQFCAASHGAVKLNEIRNAVFGISKSNTLTSFCCLRRRDTFTLLSPVIYNSVVQGVGSRGISPCRGAWVACPFPESSGNSQGNRRFCTKPTPGPQIHQCSSALLKWVGSSLILQSQCKAKWKSIQKENKFFVAIYRIGAYRGASERQRGGKVVAQVGEKCCSRSALRVVGAVWKSCA